jgi:hypothetical protein
MRHIISVLLILGLLAACKEDSVTPIPSGQWQVRYSTGMPATFLDRFAFPQAPGSVHYVVKLAPSGRGSITLQFAIEGQGELLPTEGRSPAAVRLFLQRKGDNLSGQGVFQHYRWWSPHLTLTAGEHMLSHPLKPSSWTSVFGKNDAEGFAAALANLDVVGFTFGGDFAGHGVYAVGDMTFIVRNFQVN